MVYLKEGCVEIAERPDIFLTPCSLGLSGCLRYLLFMLILLSAEFGSPRRL
jgi:hypothetical protein